MLIQYLKEKLMDKEISSYLWIPTCSMWVDALTNEMDMRKELKEVLMEGNFKLKNYRINKVQCNNYEIWMTNIRNRYKKELHE